MVIGPETFRRLVRAHALLVSEENDALTVRAIAKRIRLSPYHFIRQFAALYGATPHQLRMRARLERAKALLANGTPVTGVCMEVGYSSLGSFSALFTRCVGVPPTRFRPTPHADCFGLLAAIPEKQPALERSKLRACSRSN